MKGVTSDLSVELGLGEGGSPDSLFLFCEELPKEGDTLMHRPGREGVPPRRGDLH